MSYEQTTNTSDRSTQVEDILAELSNCRISPRLYRQIVALAGLAQITLDRREMERVRLENKRNGNAVANVANIRQRCQPHIIEEKVKKVSKYSKGANATLMPPDFSPNQEWAMKDRGWDQAKAAEEAAKFGDYAAAHSKRYSNWDAAWRNWCRSKFQQGSNGNGKTAYNRPQTERERYGQFLHSLRSEGTNQLLAGLVSKPEAERLRGNGDDVRRGHGEIPAGNRENGSKANGHSNGSSDLFAQRRLPSELAGEEIGHNGAEAYPALSADSGTD